jgi:hypothetical protein
MLRHRRTGTRREVDICIEAIAGGYAVVICVECQKRGRPADVTWVEGLIEKHEHLPTNKLILVAPGFTLDGKKLAETEGVTALTFEAMEARDFEGLLADTESLWSKTITLTVEKVVVRVASTAEFRGERVRASPDQNVYDASGVFLDVLAPLVSLLVNHPLVRMRLLGMGTEEHRAFVLRWAAPRTDSGFALHLQREDAAHTLRGVEYIEISGPCELHVAEFRLRHGKLDDVQVAWGKSQVGGKPQTLVSTRDAAGRQRLTLLVEGSPPATVELANDQKAVVSGENATANAMYYVVEGHEVTVDNWGRIWSKHVLLQDAVAECSFARQRAVARAESAPKLLILQSAQELNEGAVVSRGAELNVFDASGTKKGAQGMFS